MRYFQHLTFLSFLSFLSFSGPAALASPFEEATPYLKSATELSENVDKVISLLKAAQSDPRHAADASYNLGLIYQQQGKMALAKSAFESALKHDPKHAPSRAQLANLNLDKEPEKSLQILNTLVEEDRFQSTARNILAAYELERGKGLLEKGQKSEANEAFHAAISHCRNVLLGDPSNIHAFTNVAIAYMYLELYDQAGLVAESALKKHPNAAELHNIMGLVYLAQDNTVRATEHFLKALDSDPQNDDARLNLAALETNYGNFDTALIYITDALQRLPDNGALILSKGTVLRGLERYQDAEKAYLEAAALPGFSDRANYNLCILHHQYTRAYEKAQSWCQKYMDSLNPTDLPYAEMERRLKAIEVTLKVLKKTE